MLVAHLQRIQVSDAPHAAQGERLMTLPFRDRRDAGRQLAAKLIAYANQPDVIVLGLPRGGVPVAAEVAEALGAPLDVFLVRKLGVPGHEELAMGAIASGGVRVLNEDVVGPLAIPAAVDRRGRGAGAPGAGAARAALPRQPAAARVGPDGDPGRRRTGDRRRRCARPRRRCASSGRPGSSPPSRSARGQSARRCATWSTRSSAPRRRSRSTPSASGTKTSGRRRTPRCRSSCAVRPSAPAAAGTRARASAPGAGRLRSRSCARRRVR